MLIAINSEDSIALRKVLHGLFEGKGDILQENMQVLEKG